MHKSDQKCLAMQEPSTQDFRYGSVAAVRLPQSILKPMLADLAVAKLLPISSEMVRLMDDQPAIDMIQARDAQRAREITAPILKHTYAIKVMVGA
jgi:hypothetical protein